MSVLVAATLAAFSMESEDTWGAWLRPDYGDDVHHFAALELDARGLEPFMPLHHRLDELGGRYWTFHLDDGRETVTQINRQRHIATGQNLCAEYAVAVGASHLLLVGADSTPPDDSISKLMAVDNGIAGGDFPAYALTGPKVDRYPFPVEEKLATGLVLIERSVFRRMRWAPDPDAGLSDDFAYMRDAKQFLGVRSYVRTDVIPRHYPESISAVEDRFPGRNMKVYR